MVKPSQSGRRLPPSCFVTEWCDDRLYATAAALVFGNVFSPTEGLFRGTLAALATFGVGFVARLFGALDQHPRATFTNCRHLCVTANRVRL